MSFIFCFSSTEPREFLDSLMSLSHLDNMLFMYYPLFDLVYLVKCSVSAKSSFCPFPDNTGSSFRSFSFCYKTFFLMEIFLDLLPSNICSITFTFH